MTLLEQIMGAVAEVQGDAELNAVRFRHTATWSDGTACRFSVRDPNKGGRSSETQLQTDPIPASLRLLRVHPDDGRPTPGASLMYQGERLVLGLYADQSIWTGQQVGVCRLVDERAYPLVATVGAQGFRLRIVALDTAALTADGLSARTNNSHRGHLPPGVTLQPGEVLTTSEGDRYMVTPPVERDALGDTVGLSWQGQDTPRPPLPDPVNPDPTPDPNPSPPNLDPWWDEQLP
ncbi:hypothetical protein [Deinococcus arenicola]|uniref:Uncharacterized protein n=1 Tax=Deinococcus arenicola TaxID=2994950 RepID=A0ABU4DV35_9DEIO|nr:hypothetical protein [Deinococcus sp. ZS9-10]MDV6376243.1 hypothetical protein [Deinococcus sp. ZS9-10]